MDGFTFPPPEQARFPMDRGAYVYPQPVPAAQDQGFYMLDHALPFSPTSGQFDFTLPPQHAGQDYDQAHSDGTRPAPPTTQHKGQQHYSRGHSNTQVHAGGLRYDVPSDLGFAHDVSYPLDGPSPTSGMYNAGLGGGNFTLSHPLSARWDRSMLPPSEMPLDGLDLPFEHNSAGRVLSDFEASLMNADEMQGEW